MRRPSSAIVMSISCKCSESGSMSIDAKRRLAAAAFVALLLLSVFWPEPIVDVNRLCCHALLGVDDLSFLGREAPSWDVAFWCLAGLFALALMHPTGERRDYSL